MSMNGEQMFFFFYDNHFTFAFRKSSVYTIISLER